MAQLFKSSSGNTFFLLVWGGVTLFWIALALWEWLSISRMKSNGVVVPGQAFARQIEEHRDRRGRVTRYYHLIFTYTYEGQFYERSQQVSKAGYNRMKKGAPVQVCCLPHNPRKAILIGASADNGKLKYNLQLAAIFLVIEIGFVLFTIFGPPTRR